MRFTVSPKYYIFSILAVISGMSLMNACSENHSNESGDKPADVDPIPEPGDEDKPDTSVINLRPERLQSEEGCQLDGDCVNGAFCFHGTCTTQCTKDDECAEGYVCSPRNGRCITESFAKRNYQQEIEVDEEHPEISRQRFAITDLNAQDIEEASESDVVDTLTGFEILTPPPSTVYVRPGQASVSISLTTTKNYGDVDYLVRSIDRKSTGNLRRAKVAVSDQTGFTNYTFVLYPRTSSLGDQGKIETFQIDSAIGTFEIKLLPKQPVSGLYTGNLLADRMGGVALPVRMGIVTTPENPKSYSEIRGISIYMPVGQTDLFSPEAVDDTATRWSEIKMKKETSAKNCQSQTNCWSASYATNDFTVSGSHLINNSQHLSRAVRVEIDDFDSESMRFFGYLKDDISGLYREYDTKTGQNFWATASMTGSLNVRRTEKLNLEDMNPHLHEPAVDKILRDPEDKSQLTCTDADITKLISLIPSEEEFSSCAEITSLESWLSSDDRIKCISAAANTILSDENLTSRIITQLIFRNDDDTTPVAGFATLNDFLENCLLADGDPQKTVCIQRPEVSCAADLSALAFLDATDTADKESLMNQFHDLLRESYLGSQYAAWQQDMTTRQKWLDTADAPQFAAKEIENGIIDILDDWESNVLHAHLGVMNKQFGQYSLEVLSNMTVRSDEIDAERYTILSDYQQSWQSVSDAISVSLRRNNELLTKTTERIAKASQYYPHLFDLYLAGLVESDINKNTENTSLNGGYGNSFYDNLTTINKLNQSFDALVYMRDAEIAVSNSLNSNNDNVLSRREERARASLESAIKKRDKVFKDYQERRISQQTTSASLSDTIESLLTEIVNICGVPAACKTTNIEKIMTKPECEPLTLPFYCGFKLDQNSLPGKPARNVSEKSVLISAAVDDHTGTIRYMDANGNAISSEEASKVFTDGFDPLSDVNSGEAAESILAYRKALQHIDVTMADFIALQNKVAIAREMTDAYAKNIEAWNKKRSTLTSKISQDINEINKYLNGDDPQISKIKAIQNELNEKYTYLHEMYEDEQADLQNWKSIKAAQHEQTKTYITNIEALERLSFDLESSADIISHEFSTIAEACYVGGNLAEAAAETPGAIGSYTSSIVFHGLDGLFYTALQSAAVDSADDKSRMERDRELAEAEIEYNDMIDDEETRVRRINEEAEYVKSLNEYEEIIANADVQSEILKADIELLKQEFNREDTYARDKQELEKLRSEYKQLAQDLIGKHALVIEAQIEANNVLLHYLTLSQRASMLKSQYDASMERLAKINNLYTSPAVIFTYASDLEAVENKIELAKERIYDYLAALEYNAVRPFVDIRRAVYISRSPNDLDEILNQLENVSDNCGGKMNTVDDGHAIIVSTREMLGITTDFQNMTMKDRFHYVIANGNVPINALTRYTVDITGKELLSSGHALKSGTFELTIKDFANLQATCNAKIAGFAFKLVGQNLIKPDAGTQVHPTMTMFYNGKSTLASCQPDISAIVSDLGTSTSYGKYSTFDIEQTKISPNAGINEWGNNDTTLEQYPLASSYTVLIDPEIGENAKINWDNVEDIQIKVLYTYENVKTNNTCKY